MASSRSLSVDGLDTPRPLRRERSHSLTHLNVPSTGHPPASSPCTNGPRDPRPAPSGVTFQSPLVTPRARSVKCFCANYPRTRWGYPENKAPLEMSFLVLSIGVPMGSRRGAEFQRMVLVGRPLGRTQGIGGALPGTEQGWAVPPI